jgi:hypothetical protein
MTSNGTVNGNGSRPSLLSHGQRRLARAAFNPLEPLLDAVFLSS